MSQHDLADGSWHRLHPLSPVLKGGFFLLACIGFLLASARERLIAFFVGEPADSRGDFIDFLYQGGQAGFFLALVAIFLLLLTGCFALSWRFHTFRISSEAVEVRSGLIFRRNRKARLDRIQGISISRPFLARLVGAAQLEFNVAGNDSTVALHYLRSEQADQLKRVVMHRASGKNESSMVAAGESVLEDSSLLVRRVNEFLAPERDPAEAPIESVVEISAARLLGSLLLSDFSLIFLLAGVGVSVSAIFSREAVSLLLIIPAVLVFVGFIVRRFTRSLRFSLAATPDGIRVGYGLFTVTNDTLPPGRIHAIEVFQPLLWRTAGWWSVRINRAQPSAHEGSGIAETVILPVGTLADVHKVLDLVLPIRGTEQKDELISAGLTAPCGSGFSDAPARAAWLRPFSWRRTGYVHAENALLIRSGFLWRRLVIVPLARIQSVHLAHGPLRRFLRLAKIEIDTVSGPVRPRLVVIDAQQALHLFAVIAAASVAAAQRDRTHRWAEHSS